MAEPEEEYLEENPKDDPDAAIPAVTHVAAPATAPAYVPTGNVDLGRDRPIHKLVEQFLKLNPPRFTGTGDPEIASLWIQDLEKTFALLMCTETKKVTLAIYQLQGNANTWWRAVRESIFPKAVVPLWDTFLRVFNEQYFSRSAREQKLEEF
ncbi:uncharacterized protein LOC120291814 [Eucalyptus grandis]|uniref:uncharacterized protein LOC120291814 n=1 Tax=Eucalyptus grandis TaxID=71139 RepID=UPI00192EC3EE|nr:uncharacterized protein LOC120291814 [Eucalyptus grandis]